jgi:hypothetical protein
MVEGTPERIARYWHLRDVDLAAFVRFASKADVPKKSVFDPNYGSNGRCRFIGGKADSAAACTGFILGESLFAQMKTRTVMQQPFA